MLGLLRTITPDPVFNFTLFRHRFRMPPVVFDKVLDGVVQSDDYFVQKYNALGVRRLFPHQKVTATLRMFCYGVAVCNGPPLCPLLRLTR
ncbi:hypothetical protein PC116_g8283 [Phytophthora cactorum]|uniref:Uncharacterized protein n=1 Tax=Phytophthora cactorum TaxID=29920 RepID=A0A8T1DWC8_9STRA|nr:hypothetical protein PC111_g4359 [Phytophthora cactorum]KAG2847500.1 hypothetical protein PC112_g1053 [Phytophthora cactorum]KAG2868214.1 hypothetical protein PC113_g1282 [Phytophthora cactorum]KAG2943823.1 hypothetical protein PC115_g658 [Phytophthora cactorum]KAG2954894.1 hypothetical protein PC117_g882 [Phytophthora cactorum]